MLTGVPSYHENVYQLPPVLVGSVGIPESRFSPHYLLFPTYWEGYLPSPVAVEKTEKLVELKIILLLLLFCSGGV